MSIFRGWGFRSWFSFAALWFVALSLTRVAYRPPSDTAEILMNALLAFIAAMTVRAVDAKLEKLRRVIPPSVDSLQSATRRPAMDAWQQLGSDPQERERSINRMFDANSGTVEFDTMWDFDYTHTSSAGLTETAYSSMSFRIASNIAEINSRQRDCLRAVYLLYNAGLIDQQVWRDLTFCFVYGDGKTSIISCEYREPIKLPFNDYAGAIKYYADCNHATVDGAVSKLFSILEAYAAKPDVPPVVQALLYSTVTPYIGPSMTPVNTPNQ